MSDTDGGQSKVLRIGVVQRNAIIKERELSPEEGASIGTSEDASFTVDAKGLPARVELFSHDTEGYRLHLHSDLEGRISLDGGATVETLKAMRAGGKIKGSGEDEYLRLSPAARGKVTIAGVTVLFNFRRPTLTGPSPLIEDDGEPIVLPPGINVPFWQDIDTQFAAILLIVALCQISFIAYVRSLTYVESASIDQIAPQYQRLIMPDRFMPKPEEPKLAEAGNTKAEEAKPAKKKPKKKPSPGKKGGGEASAKAKKAALAKKVAGKGLLKVLGAKGGAGGAIADVFSEGSGEGGDLGDAFSGIQGVDIATEGGQTGSRGGGSGEGVGIGDLKTGGGGSLKRGQKTETLVRGSARTGAPDVDGELSQAQINRVVKRQLKSLRDCYERALKRNRKLAGKVVINFEILETGRTSSIDVDDRMGSSVVRSCISGRVKYWRFPRPKGGSVFVSYPVVFTPAG